MKKLLIITLGIFLLTVSSCSKDKNPTRAIINLTDVSGTPVSGITVYAYDSGTWDAFGDNVFFADKTVSSDASGKCTFELDDIINLFAFDSQETIYFSAHYTLNSLEKEKYISITFNEGEEKTGAITLD
jgi:hypothetical protein